MKNHIQHIVYTCISLYIVNGISLESCHQTTNQDDCMFKCRSMADVPYLRFVVMHHHVKVLKEIIQPIELILSKTKFHGFKQWCPRLLSHFSQL